MARDKVFTTKGQKSKKASETKESFVRLFLFIEAVFGGVAFFRFKPVLAWRNHDQ